MRIIFYIFSSPTMGLKNLKESSPCTQSVGLDECVSFSTLLLRYVVSRAYYLRAYLLNESRQTDEIVIASLEKHV